MKTTITISLFSFLLLSFLNHEFALASKVEAGAEAEIKTLIWPDGTRYVGGFENGKRTGRGTIFWQEGSRFIGYFENDMRNGPGTMILPDGTVYRGYFKDDKLVYTETSIPTSDPNEIEDIEQDSLNQTAQIETKLKNAGNPESIESLSLEKSSNQRVNSERSAGTSPTQALPEPAPTQIAQAPKTEKTEAPPEPAPTQIAQAPKTEKTEAPPEPAPTQIAQAPKTEKTEASPEPAASNITRTTKVENKKLGSSTKESLTNAIDRWAKAWSDQNVKTYLSSYSKDFSVPGNRSREDWENLRENRLTRPKFIKVTLDYQRFVQIEKNVVDVFFRQTYSSNTYKDVTDKVLRMTKVLRMRKEDSDWKILIERAR